MTTTTDFAAEARPPLERGGYREVVTLAYPVVLTQLSATALGVVDSAMVGRLGATELAAVGFGAIWIWTVFSLMYGTASGIQTFVSQADGAGQPRACGRWAWHGFYAVVPATALLVALLLPLAGPLFALLGPSAEMQTVATEYVRVRLLGEVGFAVVMVFTSFFRGFGDTRTPLYVTLFVNAVNLVLDYGLIFGELGMPRWGIAGAAVATVIAQWLGAVVLFACFRRRAVAERFDTKPVAPDFAAIRRFLRTGAPIGGQWCIGMTAFATFTTFVAWMGDSSAAASQALVMLLSLSFMQAIGISIAASTLVGRYVGAEDPPAVQRSLRTSLALGAGLAGVVALLFVSVPDLLLSIFTDDPIVAQLGRPVLLLGALFQVFDAVAIITEGALRGAGDTRWPFGVQTALGWGFFVPLSYFLGVTLDGGLTAAWCAGLVYVAVLAAVLLARFRSGAWQRIRI